MRSKAAAFALLCRVSLRDQRDALKSGGTMRLRSFLAAIFLLVDGLLADALPVAAEQAPQQQVQTFGESIDVRVVNVEAVVVDKKGERVRGLSAADFRLLVDGREVPIE